MSGQRYVPVKLIAGKEYVLRNGRHVTVRENPHWQCRVNYPFAVIQGPDFVVYYDEEGNTGGGTAHEHDIMRPVYKDGEVYLDRNGKRRVIDLDDNSSTYPLEDDERDESWTRDGRVSHCATSEREDDLMDYEQPKRGALFALLGQPVFKFPSKPIFPPPIFNPIDNIPIPPPEPADPWVGKRVHLREDGREGYGVVHKRMSSGSDCYTIKVDEPCDWGHSGDGDLGQRGWNVHKGNLTLAELQGKRADLVIVDEVFAVPELAPVEASPSLVGLRVEVNLDCATTARGVVKFEDTDGYVAVEIDADVQWQGLHSCNGHCNDERGWWELRDSLRAVSEAETPVEAERSEALTEVDVAEVWAAYRINPSIDIDSWIAARRKLKAAAK